MLVPRGLLMPHPSCNGELASQVMVKQFLRDDYASRSVKLVHWASLLSLVNLKVIEPGGLIGLGGKQLHSSARCPAHLSLACKAVCVAVAANANMLSVQG